MVVRQGQYPKKSEILPQVFLDSYLYRMNLMDGVSGVLYHYECFIIKKD